MSARPRRSVALAGAVGRTLAYAYVPVLVAVVIIRAATGADLAHAWAASPERLAHGRVWTLLTSALVVDRVQALQLVLIVLLTWFVLRRYSPGAFWLALLGGHVGSTLVAYAGIGPLWARGPQRHIVWSRPDFGISCVWMTMLCLVIGEALLGTVLRRRWAWWASLVATVAIVLTILSTTDDIAVVEHALAATVGVGAALWGGRALRGQGHRAAGA